MDPWVVDTVRALQDFEGGRDTNDLTTCALNFAYETLPDPPVTPDAPLTTVGAAWSGSPGDDVDHISNLPDQILRNVVSRLPAKDVACTCALASRWRGLCHSVPLVFIDTHLLPMCRVEPL
jgi:hypothetical protein